MNAGILFADLRGFTSYSETRRPEEVAVFLNHFYRITSDVLVGAGAIIDKLSGDGVMAIFVPGFSGPSYVANMVAAAEALIRDARVAGGQSSLQLGVGLDHGLAFVGNVGVGEIKDFTAIGDVVNTASRLQHEAQAGQIVMSDAVFAPLADRYPDARSTELELRGKAEPVRAHIVDVLGVSRTAL